MSSAPISVNIDGNTVFAGQVNYRLKGMKAAKLVVFPLCAIALLCPERLRSYICHFAGWVASWFIRFELIKP